MTYPHIRYVYTKVTHLFGVVVGDMTDARSYRRALRKLVKQVTKHRKILEGEAFLVFLLLTLN